MPDDYSDVINFQDAKSSVVGAVGSNPDNAANALSLSKATGVPAPAIVGDVDGFKQGLRQQTALGIVQSNPHVANFVSNPINAQVSNDDLAQLDSVSHATQDAAQSSVWDRFWDDRTLKRTGQAIADSYDFADLDAKNRQIAQLYQSPIWKGIAPWLNVGYTAGTLGFETLDAIFKGGAAFTAGVAQDVAKAQAPWIGKVSPTAEQFLTNKFGSDQGADNFQKELNGFVDFMMVDSGAHGSLHQGPTDLHAALAPYRDAGKPIPVGAAPITDAVHILQNDADLSRLRNALAEAVGSRTRERAPDQFKEFVNQHVGDAQLGIDPKAVQALYGDKAPGPGDGLLGFVSDLPSQLLRSAVTGQDIRVPVDAYLTHMQPEVSAQIEPHIRTRDGGITQAEIGQQVYAQTDDGIRQQAGLSPQGWSSIEPTFTHQLPAPPDGSIQWLRKGPDGDLLYLNRKGGVDTYANVHDPAPLVNALGALRDVVGNDQLTHTQIASVEVARRVLEHVGADQVPTYAVSPKNPAVNGMLGAYYRDSDAIILRHTGDPAQMLRTTVHESYHAAFAHVIDTDPEISGALSWLNDLAKNAHEATLNLDDTDVSHYGLTNSHEFISEAFSNPTFQKFLSDTKLTPEQQTAFSQYIGEIPKSGLSNMWDAFLMLARKAFGLPMADESMSLLDAAFKVGDRLTAAAAEGRVGEGDALSQKVLGQTIADSVAKDRATALGMSREQFIKFRSLLEDQNNADQRARMSEILKEENRRQTQEWKDNATQVRAEMAKAVPARPEIQADTAIRRGKKLDTDSLTEEQKSALPQDYHSRGGLHPDDLADQTGFDTGDKLVESVSKLVKDRGDVQPMEYNRKLVKDATEAEMERRYGNLGDNVLEAAKDRVLSDTQMKVLYAEAEAGSKNPVSLDRMKQQAKDEVGQTKMSDVSSDASISAAGRAVRRLMNAVPDDPRTVVTERMNQLNHLLSAKEFQSVEALKDRFDKMMKTYSAQKVSGVDQDYLNQMHNVMQKLGLAVKRTSEEVLSSLQGTGFDSLEKFVEQKTADGRDLHMPDWLSDFTGKVDDLTTDQFRQLNDFFTAMRTNGRNENSIIRAGEKADFEVTRNEMVAKLEEALPNTIRPGSLKSKVGAWTAIKWSHLNMESMLTRLDRDNVNGVFTQTLTRMFTDAANQEARQGKELTLRLANEIGDLGDLNKAVDNGLLKDPQTGDFLDLKRKNILGIIQTAGNRDNLSKLIGGYKIDAGDLWKYLKETTTPEDWDRAQKIGNIFEELYKQANDMSVRISGVGINKIPLEPFVDPHGVTRDGWYHPIAYDGFLGRDVTAKPADIDNLPHFRATTPQGYTISRNRYIAPLELSLDMTTVRMKQMVHDINAREATIQLNKFLQDPTLTNAIKRQYGPAQLQEMQSFVKRFAGETDAPTGTLAVINRGLGQGMSNFVSTGVGLNPNTFTKHGLSAAASSFSRQPIGFSAELARVTGEIFTGSKSWKMAMEKSDELGHRSNTMSELRQMWGSDLSLNRMGSTSTFKDLRQFAMAIGSKPIAFFDHLSAVPLWLTEYRQAISAGENEGMASFIADRAVRETHGSTLSTNRPGIAASRNALVKGYAGLYNFFSEKLQQQYKAAWLLRDALGMAQEGSYADAGRNAARAAGLMVVSSFIPALIDYWVYRNREDVEASWSHTMTKLGVMSAGSGWLGFRDMANAIETGREVNGNMVSSMMNTVVDVGHDIYPDKHGNVAVANPQKVGRFLKRSAILAGSMTGLMNAQEGRMAEFAWDYFHGYTHPNNAWQMYIGFRNGTLKNHTRSYDEWLKQDITDPLHITNKH